MEQLEVKINELSGAIQTYIAKSTEELKTLGATQKETQETLNKLAMERAEDRKQLNAIDERIQAKNYAETAEVSFEEYLLKETEAERLFKEGLGSHASCPKVKITVKGHHLEQMLGLKTTLTSDNVGSTPRQTTGVLALQRIPGIVEEARRQIILPDLLSTVPTDAWGVDFVKVANAMADAATQSPEGGAKSENAITFSSQSEKIKTIATWIPATRQVLADMPGLRNVLENGLVHAVRRELEDQVLNGNGAGETIRGVQPQATAFDTALLPAASLGWTLIDILGWSAAQIAIANEIRPTFALLNPQDLWEVRMTKDADGRYILGDPTSQNVPNIFGLRLIDSSAQSQGTFLVGSTSAEALQFFSRMQMEVAIAAEHSDYFTKNLVAIRAELRGALVTYRPASFISGATTTSPA